MNGRCSHLASYAFFGSIVLLSGANCRALAAPTADARYEVSVHEVWIPMKDGVRLSATLYVPTPRQHGEKFAAILEYLPYRKDELTSYVRVHDYFARRGFVSARVDIRGTGRSEGHAPEREYSQIEQQDAERVIAWLAHQDWSNGSVGMFGISWGGFNSVQMAMRNPPGLKAIIAICATEDLFREDVHFIDGMMHDDEYELNVDLQQAMTRSPDFPTDEASLAQRFDNPSWFVMYKQHPRADAFWDTPVRPLSSIKIPVFLIGGMLDGYRDSIPRMLQEIKAPTKALLGPWNHSEPDEAVPGPAIEWRDQAVEWWTHWLKHSKRELEGPKLAVYMNHWYPPDVQLREIPGEWRAEDNWPPKGMRAQTLYLSADHSLGTATATAVRHELVYRPAAVQEAGGPDFWWGDLGTDQRSVDAYSLVYDSAPLQQPLSILGRPRVCLQAAANAPAAEWFVRVSDVAPNEMTTLVSGAGLNGAHRESLRNPTPLEPGREYALCFDLHLTSWVFPPRHRIRVAVSNAMWPMIWPTPYPMTTSLRLGGTDGSRIDLPVVPDRGSLPVPKFRTPDPMAAEASSAEATAAPAEMNVSSNVPALSWTVNRDPVHQRASAVWRGGSSADYPWGREDTRELMTYQADDLHPETSAVHGEAEMAVTLKDRALLWRGILDTHSDKDFFYVQYKRELLENGALIRSKSWQATVPRDGQ